MKGIHYTLYGLHVPLSFSLPLPSSFSLAAVLTVEKDFLVHHTLPPRSNPYPSLHMLPLDYP